MSYIKYFEADSPEELEEIVNDYLHEEEHPKITWSQYGFRPKSSSIAERQMTVSVVYFLIVTFEPVGKLFQGGL